MNSSTTPCGSLNAAFPEPFFRFQLETAEAVLIQSIPTLVTTAFWLLVEFTRPSFTRSFRIKASVLGILVAGTSSVVAWRILERLSCAGLAADAWRVVAGIASLLASLALLVVALWRPRASVIFALLVSAAAVFGEWATQGNGIVQVDLNSSPPPFMAAQHLWALLVVCLIPRLHSARHRVGSSTTRIWNRTRSASKRSAAPSGLLPMFGGLPLAVDTLQKRSDVEGTVCEPDHRPGRSWFS